MAARHAHLYPNFRVTTASAWTCPESELWAWGGAQALVFPKRGHAGDLEACSTDHTLRNTTLASPPTEGHLGRGDEGQKPNSNGNSSLIPRLKGQRGVRMSLGLGTVGAEVWNEFSCLTWLISPSGWNIFHQGLTCSPKIRDPGRGLIGSGASP